MIKTRINNEYKDIIKIFGGGPLQKEITKVWSREANKYVYESEVEYTDTLPLSITADGNALLDYRIYGNTVQDGTPTPENPIMPNGVGERTENLAFTGWAEDFVTRAATDRAYITQVDGRTCLYAYCTIGYNEYDTKYMFKTDFKESTVYTLSFEYMRPSNFNASTTICVLYTDGTKVPLPNYINDGDWHKRTFTTASEKTVKSICCYYTSGYVYIDINTFMVVEGSTAPSSYIPYGYKLPMTVQSANLWNPNSRTNNQVGQLNWGVVLPSGTYTIKNDSDTTIYFRDGIDTTTAQRFANAGETGTKTAINEFVAWCNSSQSAIMLNLGSTALPYEPYRRTVTNIYLGKVETTRRIKKLVLTGEENWTISATWKGASTSVFYIISSDIISIFSTAIFILSDRFKAASRNTIYTEDSDMIARTGSASITIRVSDSIATTVADLKSYLAAQYAAGTPVTVWYVLAEPETAVVNEPLMKIGDYADTLSMEQAGVSIPTFAGTTVIDYDGTPKPSQMYIKYRR
jgi:hypothetical protein